MATEPRHLTYVAGSSDGAFAPIPVTIENLPTAGAPTWASITGKPAVIAAGADAASARTAIGAGTSSLTAAQAVSAVATKTQVAALAAVSAANAAAAAADPPTKAEFDVLVTLANANKAAINAIIAALKA